MQVALRAMIAIAAAASCRAVPSAAPVPVEGSQDQLSKVSGEWSGRYWSKATGRHGIIKFRLPEHADTGFGEVEIVFSPGLRLVRDASSADGLKKVGDDPGPSTCTHISLKIIRVHQNQVQGMMAPYWDPDCDCRAQTVFEGQVLGDRIEGTYNSRRESADRRVVTGQWRVDREQQS